MASRNSQTQGGGLRGSTRCTWVSFALPLASPLVLPVTSPAQHNSPSMHGPSVGKIIVQVLGGQPQPLPNSCVQHQADRMRLRGVCKCGKALCNCNCPGYSAVFEIVRVRTAGRHNVERQPRLVHPTRTVEGEGTTMERNCNVTSAQPSPFSPLRFTFSDPVPLHRPSTLLTISLVKESLPDACVEYGLEHGGDKCGARRPPLTTAMPASGQRKPSLSMCLAL